MMSFIIPRGAAHAAAALAFTLCGCAVDHHPSSNGSRHATDDTAAIEASFRYLFANNGSVLRDRAGSYCIGTGERPRLADPNASLLKALSDVQPRAAPVSLCRTDTRVVNAAGEPSLVFFLAPVRCDSRDDCLFTGGYYEGNLSASNGMYRARRINGSWQVQPEGPQAVS